MKTGLYIGRFQPFHLGHFSIVKRALKEVDHLIIGIGSAQYSHQEKNPFSAIERKEIIKRTLEEENIEPIFYRIIEIEDINNNEKWPSHVQSLSPPFDMVFTGDYGIVKELFEKYTDVPVRVFDEVVQIRATDVRKMIAESGNWKNFLSKSAAEYIESIGGIDRIKQL